MPGAISRTGSRSPGGSGGRTWRSAASRTWRSPLRSPGKRPRPRSTTPGRPWPSPRSTGSPTDPVAALAFAVGGGSLACLGRFAEAEQWLEKAERALRHQQEPSTELALLHARGLLRSGQGRFEAALAEFRSAEAVKRALAGEHALAVDLRLRIVSAQLRLGETAAARAALAGVTDTERDRAEPRIAAAAIALADGEPEVALERLAPVIERAVPSLVPRRGRPSTRCCTTRRRGSSSAIRAPRTRRWSARSSWPSRKARSCRSRSHRSATCSSATPGCARHTRRWSRRSSTSSRAPRRRPSACR